MRRNLKILFYASLAVLFSSCENLFKEECEAKGFLSATVSDKGPVPSTTEEIQVRYYDYHTGVEHTEKLGEPDYFALGNRFLSQLDAGTYRFLAYTRFNNKIRNAGDISTIEIYADTVVSAKYACPVIANPQHLVFMGKESGTILPEDTTYREFVLSPMVQKIIFNVTIRGLAPAQTVSGMEALLKGVIISRKIYTNQSQLPMPVWSLILQKKRGNILPKPMCSGFPIRWKTRSVWKLSPIQRNIIRKWTFPLSWQILQLTVSCSRLSST